LFEERYTLPLLPLMMVGLGIIIGKLFKNKTNI